MTQSPICSIVGSGSVGGGSLDPSPSSNVAVAIGSAGDLTVDSYITLDPGGAVSDSGRVTVPGIDLQSGATGIVLAGGTLRAGADFTTTAPITISAGGGTIDTNGYNTVFDGSLAGPGGLTKIGAGAATFSGANSYQGGTTVSAGTLIFTSPSAIPANTSLTIEPGGIMIFDPSLAGSPSEVTAATTPAIASSAGTADTSSDTTAASNATSSGTSVTTAAPVAANVAFPSLVLLTSRTVDISASGSVATPGSASVSNAVGDSPVQASAAVATPPVALPLPASAGGPQTNSLAGALRTPAAGGDARSSVARALFPNTLPPRPSLAVPDAGRQATASPRIAADLVWLGQTENGSDSSDLERKKYMAIQALDAVFAEYG